MSSHSLTLSANRILRALITPTSICLGFDPKNPPQPLPAMYPFQGVWDTGATNTVISQRVVDACGLKPIGIAKVSTAGGECMCEEFLINIQLQNQVRFPNVRVTKADMGKTDVLIGMNIITLGDFALTHKDRKTCFSFRLPSAERIDFVNAAPIINRNKQGRNEKCACGSGQKYKHCCGKSV